MREGQTTGRYTHHTLTCTHHPYTGMHKHTNQNTFTCTHTNTDTSHKLKPSWNLWDRRAPTKRSRAGRGWSASWAGGWQRIPRGVRRWPIRGSLHARTHNTLLAPPCPTHEHDLGLKCSWLDADLNLFSMDNVQNDSWRVCCLMADPPRYEGVGSRPKTLVWLIIVAQTVTW